MDCLVRFKKKEIINNVNSFIVSGLNIFTANQTCPNEFGKDTDLPFLKFFNCMMEPYETIALIGAPAMRNWIHYVKCRRDETVSPETVLGKDIFYHTLSLIFYNGSFVEDWQRKYGPSILFRLSGDETVLKLLDIFMGWDAVAFFLFEKGDNGLGFTKETLEKYQSGNDIISAVLQKAGYFIKSEGDCQYLEIYSNRTDAENQIKAACEQAERYIKSTEWYFNNKDKLLRNDLDMCFFAD